MSTIKLKITCHIKNREHFNLNEERQEKDASTEMTEISELSGINYKAAILKMLQQPIMNMLETSEKIESLKK